MRLLELLFVGVLVSVSGPGVAGTSYVAPIGAKPACAKADGTEKCPWTSLDQALLQAKSGDTILLMDGSHGLLKTSRGFDSMVTIRSKNGRNAQIDAADFGDGARNIQLRDLEVWRTGAEFSAFLIRAMKGTSRLQFENLDMRSREDAVNYRSWSAERWVSVAGNGFDLRGGTYIIRGNSIKGTKTGIIAGYDSLVVDNTIDGFCGDGIKGVGKSVIRSNQIMNRIKVDTWHSDGIQFATKTSMKDIVIDSNKIIEWVGNPDHPLRGGLQGIGMFDGPYENLLIQNNVFAGRNSHGIAVFGAYHAQILNNTVVSLSGKPSKYPFIRVKPLKDGTPSQDVLIANNLAMGFDGSTNVIFQNNKVISDPSMVFANVSDFDYLPKATSGFIDKGVSPALSYDIRGNGRPAGSAPDLGAYEAGSTLALRTAPMTMDAWANR